MVNAPWFFADCKITEGDMSVRSNPIQLHELSVNSNVAIMALYVVSPPHMNWTDSWKMDQVVRVSKGLTNEMIIKLRSIYTSGLTGENTTLLN